MSNIEIKDTFIYKSTDIAKYLLALANEKKIAINMTKLQKLLYITYGVYLRVYNNRLLNEHPQAWPYGPVFPTTRNRLINVDLCAVNRNDIDIIHEIEKDDKLNKAVNFVFEKFGTWNAGQLSEWSHSENSPWDKTQKEKGFKWGSEISDQSIYEYFCSIITLRNEEEQ